MSAAAGLFPDRRLIADLQLGEKVDGYFRVLECSRKKKKDGSDFLTLLLMDKSGRLYGKMWENADEYNKMIQPGGIYRCLGEVSEYNGKKEIRLLRIAPLSGRENDFQAEDYEEAAPFDTAARLKEMRELLAAHITAPYLQKLLEAFFLAYGDKLQNHPGAMRIHHAYPGGLLEHTCCLLQLALPVAELYGLDKELLLVGALLHDVGKLFEFQAQPAPETTLAGGLLGHIVIGNDILRELVKSIDGFPPERALKLQHLLVAHHGEKEFGSPEVPRIPEAYVLHVLDMLDSRLNIFLDLGRRTDGKGLFSDFNSILGTRILIEKE